MDEFSGAKLSGVTLEERATEIGVGETIGSSWAFRLLIPYSAHQPTPNCTLPALRGSH